VRSFTTLHLSTSTHARKPAQVDRRLRSKPTPPSPLCSAAGGAARTVRYGQVARPASACRRFEHRTSSKIGRSSAGRVQHRKLEACSPGKTDQGRRIKKKKRRRNQTGHRLAVYRAECTPLPSPQDGDSPCSYLLDFDRLPCARSSAARGHTRTALRCIWPAALVPFALSSSSSSS
jgi:hypothetical protein